LKASRLLFNRLQLICFLTSVCGVWWVDLTNDYPKVLISDAISGKFSVNGELTMSSLCWDWACTSFWWSY
jgi:hypothetical protein